MLKLKVQSLNTVKKFVYQGELSEKEQKEWNLTLRDLLENASTFCDCLDSTEIFIEYYPPDKHCEFTNEWLNGKGIPLKIGAGCFLLKTTDNSVMVCLTGDDFEEMYGHMLGEGHMTGGMMGDINDGETKWQHHMDDEHQPGDEHFGGFDMNHHTFSYTFEMMNGEIPYELHFQGSKQ